MARAAASPTAAAGLNRRLRRWLAAERRRLRPAVATSAAACRADRYRKHFDSYGHVCLLLCHGLSGGESLRQSYAAFATCPGLVTLSGLTPCGRPALVTCPTDEAEAAADAGERLRVSYSQFAASNTSRPATVLRDLVPALVARVRALGRLVDRGIPPDLHLLDSTFRRVSLALAPWLPSRGGADVAGVRLQVRDVPALDLPEHVLVTDTRTNDCQGLDLTVLDVPETLAALRGDTLVVDLGYYRHRRFAQLRAAQVHFVSRLQPQATVQVETDVPVQLPLPHLASQAGGHARVTVLADQRVTVGSANNRAGAVLPGLRLVTARVAPVACAAQAGALPVVYRVLTDRWDLLAHDVVAAYLWRWQIELFFRWLKSTVHLPRLLGASRNAVELTVWLALVVHLLTLLAAHALGLRRRSPVLLHQLPWVLAHVPLDDLAAAIADTPVQLPLPLSGSPGRDPPESL